MLLFRHRVARSWSLVSSEGVDLDQRPGKRNKTLSTSSLRASGGVLVLMESDTTPSNLESSISTIERRAFEREGSNLNANTSLGLDTEARDPDGFWPSLIDPDPAARELRINYVKEVINLAVELGVKNVCTATGRLEKGVPPEQAMTWLKEGFEKILFNAERKPQVRVGIEYEPGFFLGDAATVTRFLNEMDHPLLGVNLDIGHVVCVGDDITETVKSLGPRIWNLHLEDIKGTEHYHLIPGQGDIDFAVLRKALDEIAYEGFLTLELYPYKDNPGEAGEEGLEYLRPFFR